MRARSAFGLLSPSALLMAMPSSISMMPRFIPCNSSPAPASIRSAVAIGADGLVVEVHPCPEKAFSDGAQSLKLADFAQLMRDLQPYLRLWKEARAALAPAVA